MQGHLRKRGDRWAFVIELERDPVTGKRRQKWASGYKTKAEAQRALRAKLKVIDDGGDAFPEALDVRTFVVEQWLPYLERQGKLAQRTVENYSQLWRDHALPVIGRKQLRAIRVSDIQRVLDTMTDRGKAPGTVGHCRSAMSAAFTRACKSELILANPVRFAEPPTKEAAELRVPTAAELRKIIEQAKGTRWEVAILLSATTGARRNEVLGLRWANLDLDLGRVTIAEALAQVDGRLTWVEPKTARSTRVIPLRPFVVDRLRAHRREQAERLLALGIRQSSETSVADNGSGEPLDPDSYTRRGKEIAAAAGVPDCHLHAFRHGVLTALANQGDLAIASEIAGHSSLAFTHSVYVHTDESRVARHDEALGRALDGAG